MEKRAALLELFLKTRLVCTDTRKVKPGAIYFALKGENFDGNKYASQALEKGCAYAVVDDKTAVQSEDYFLVDDVLVALQELSQDYRETLSIPIIGITGTNGKTTTKELLHAVLSTTYNCYATAGNLNNHIGVPLTLLSITDEHEIAIVEMGASKPGDIAELCAFCRPTCGLITNVGYAHLEGFGGFDMVKKTKKELYDYLGATHGLVFINKDNDELKQMAVDLSQLAFYSMDKASPLKGELTKSDVTLRFKWKTLDYTSEEVITNLTGRYNLENALAAVAVGSHFKVTNDSLKRSIEAYAPSNNRSQIKRTKTNTLILDAYNANITSTKAALNNLAEIEVPQEEKYFILGDMLELGEESFKAHKDIMSLSVELELSGVFVGAEYKHANTENTFTCYTSAVLLKEDLAKHSLENRLILIKGSRGIKLEVLEENL